MSLTLLESILLPSVSWAPFVVACSQLSSALKQELRKHLAVLGRLASLDHSPNVEEDAVKKQNEG